jgi:hypothetical protein
MCMSVRKKGGPKTYLYVVAKKKTPCPFRESNPSRLTSSQPCSMANKKGINNETKATLVPLFIYVLSLWNRYKAKKQFIRVVLDSWWQFHIICSSLLIRFETTVNCNAQAEFLCLFNDSTVTHKEQCSCKYGLMERGSKIMRKYVIYLNKSCAF